MAQDFYKAFHVGNDSLSISTIDPAGIALIGVQTLDKKLADSIAVLKKENRSLQQQIADLQLQMNAMLSSQAIYQKDVAELKELIKGQASANAKK